MAVLRPKPRVWFAAALLACVLAAGVPPAGAAAPRSPPEGPLIQVDASNSQLDTRASRLTLLDVTITQGELSIKAARAVVNGADGNFRDSTWDFTGDVRVHFDSGTVRADQASVQVAANKILRAQLTGAPADFEQQLASMPRPVRGHAGGIELDLTAQLIRLSGDAWLFDGRNELTSQTLVYSIKDQMARSEQAPGSVPGRVHITIRPDGVVDPAAPAARQ
jgi:lipopolysaccharide transport protein LptA